MARDTSGRFVVAGGSGSGGGFGSGGDFALVRYTANGSLDTTFGGDGKVTVSFVADQTKADEAWAVATQPDGKIVAAGVAAITPGDGGDFAVLRLNADGVPDATFGGGDGRATVNFVHDQARAVALQGDGKIVVAGSTGDGFALARLNPDGTPDTSFDTDGKVTTELLPDGFSDRAQALAIQPDGKIVAAGSADPADGGSDFGLVRYQADGSLDTSFGVDGIVTTAVSQQATFNDDEADALVVQPDGKLVAAGQANMDPANFALVRYHPDGALDTGFGGDGKVTTSLSPVGSTSVAHALAIRGDNKLIAAGRAANSQNFKPHHDFALARYNADGSLDTGFDGDGKVTTEVAPTPQVDIARALVVQPDGKAVAAGYADMGPPDFLDYDVAIVRHLPNGDVVPPAVPTVSATSPVSPANANSPRVKGTADTGSTVEIHDRPGCSNRIATGSAAEFTSAGITAPVPSDATTTLYARAIDPSGNRSGCSTTSVTYVEDSTPPPPPVFTDTQPPSPADHTTPRILGSAEAGSTVRLYRNLCSSFFPPEASGSAAEFASPGIQVSVDDGSFSTFYATATDAAGNVSGCSASITYAEEGGEPTAPADDGGDPPRISTPRRRTHTARVRRGGWFTLPRTQVRCARDGGVCDVAVRASTANKVAVKSARKRRRVLTLARREFTVEAGERSRVKLRLARRAVKPMRRLGRVTAVAAITVTNLRETTAKRTVRFVLKNAKRRR